MCSDWSDSTLTRTRETDSSDCSSRVPGTILLWYERRKSLYLIERLPLNFARPPLPISIVILRALDPPNPPISVVQSQGDKEKSLVEVLKELVECDEPSVGHSELPADAQTALEEVRERRLMMGCGAWSPTDGGFDDFRLVLQD